MSAAWAEFIVDAAGVGWLVFDGLPSRDPLGRAISLGLAELVGPALRGVPNMIAGAECASDKLLGYPITHFKPDGVAVCWIAIEAVTIVSGTSGSQNVRALSGSEVGVDPAVDEHHRLG